MLKGIDASFSRMTAAVLSAFKAEGYSVFVQDTWTGNAHPGGSAHCRANLDDGLASGFFTAPYVNIWGASRDKARWHIDKGREPIGDLWPRLNHIAIDVETRPVTIDCIIEAVAYVRELGQRATVYLSPGFWDGSVEGRTAAKDAELASLAPLWKASWGVSGRPTTGSLTGFAPWGRAVGHQRSGGNFRRLMATS